MIETKGIDLQEWAVDKKPSKDMLYYEGYWHQIMFVRDRLTSLIFGSRTDGDKKRTVIGTHVSKSVLLPVYHIEVDHLGLSLVMRGNFHDWKVSVISNKAVTCDFMNLIKEDEKWSHHYCEGFDHQYIFPSYAESKTRFTVELSDEYALYSFVLIMLNHLKS